jgi:hypothetical protein
MRVLMMFIMSVAMRVPHPLVRMLVLVVLSKVKPNAARHERRGDPERRRCRLAECEDRDCCAKEWCS